MIVSCKQCHHDFQVTKTRKQFCCVKCKDDHFRKHINLTKLAEFASNGDKASYMAAVFGVSPPTITRALQTHGLYGTWQAMRYA